MKNRKMLMSLIAAMLIAAAGYIVWDLYIIRPLAGEYVSVDAKDSLYELTLSKAGRINVVDVGAGNPALEGFVFAVPDSVNRLRIKTYGETDGAFLGIKDHKLSIYPASLGYQPADSQTPVSFHIITLETDSESMQFNEKGYE